MEKTKRLSKSSIAVIVLSILLVLSMVMGLTGAWFSDADHGSGSNTLNLGKVVVTATHDISVTDNIPETREKSAELKQLVPGDQITVGDAVITSGADVKEYVYYTYEVTIKAQGKEVTAVSAEGVATYGEASERELKNAKISTAENAVKAFAFTDATQKTLKYFEAGASYTIPTFTISFSTDTYAGNAGNFVYVDGVRYVVNKGTTYVPAVNDVDISDSNVVITVTLHAYALQYDNVDYDTLNAWLTNCDASHGIAAFTAESLSAWQGVADNKVVVPAQQNSGG